MKKTSLFSLTAVAAITAISLVAPLSTYAVTNAETDGTAGFSVDDDLQKMPIVKPGTDTLINPEAPLATKPVVNDVVLSYAPNFNFGTKNTIALGNGTTEYKAKYNRYQYSDDATKDYEIPQFVQVADASGTNYTDWAVTLKQADVFSVTTGTGSSAVTDSLTNTRIHIKGQTTTNNLITTNVADAITGLTIPTTGATQYTQVPVTNAAADEITVLKSVGDKTKAGSSTNGTKSSVVFKNGYVETDYSTVSTASDVDVRGENEDIVLAVPSSDKVLKKNYSAKLVWTLSATPKP